MSITSLRVAFMGTPAWSVPIVEALHQIHPISVVYSQPPRPQSRGHKIQPSPVHAWAFEKNIPVETPATLRTPEAEAAFRRYAFDWVVVAAYGLILPKYALSVRYGATNVHASLLPRWRGAAPLHRAMLEGDQQTGITIMQMEEGLDTGPIWSMQAYPLTSRTSITQLHDDMARLGGDLLVKTTSKILSGVDQPVPQPTTGITYADKIKKEEGHLDFTKRSSGDVERRVRALSGWPGTFFEHHGLTYKVHAVHVTSQALDPGTHHQGKAQWWVGCADGIAVSLDVLQKPGGKPMPTAELMRGL